MALRKARLARQPFCVDCEAQGRTTSAITPDHIVPLALGGEDTEDNIRCLCAECHRKRTAEQFGHKTAQTIDITGWPE